MGINLLEISSRIMNTGKKFGSFVFYIALAGVLVWGFAQSGQPVYSLFESSISPVEAPTNTPPPPPTNTPEPLPPTNTPEPIPTDTPVPIPTDTPVPEQVVQPAPTDTPIPAEPTATEPPLVEEVVLTPTPLVSTVESTEPLTATIPQPLQPQPVTPPTVNSPAQPVATETGELVVNQVALVDTIVKVLAYVWICIGAVAILLALIFFPLLQIRGAHLKRIGK